MALNLPNSPADGDTHLGSNGINYVYDASQDRWLVETDTASAVSLFIRDPADTSISPIYDGDSISVNDNAGAEQIRIDPTAGVTLSAGLKFTGEFDIDNLTALP